MTPDQTRYGPSYPTVVDGIPHERVGLLLYVWEGGGWSVTCSCTWHRWSPDKSRTLGWGQQHARPTKKGDDVTYECAELRRLNKSK